MSDLKETNPLPNGWRWARLDEISKLYHGGTPSKTEPTYWGGDIPWISPKDMRSSRISTTEDYVTAAGVASCATRIVDAGSIFIVVRSGILARRLPVAISALPSTFNQDIKAILPTDVIEGRYLSYVISHQEKYILDRGVKKGATVHSLKSGFLESLEIAVPPLPEQRRIADLLDAAIMQQANARAAAEFAVSELQVAEAEQMVRALTDLTRVAPLKPLGALATLRPSKSIASDGDKEVQAVTTACLREQGFNVAGVKSARMRSEDALVSLLEPGEILIARSNTPELVGRVGMYAGEPSNVVASDLTIRLWAESTNARSYLRCYLSSLFSSGYWLAHAHGASGTMKKIRRSQLLELQIPAPDGGMLKEFVARATEVERNFERVRAAATAQLAAINALPGALLSAAFRGEL